MTSNKHLKLKIVGLIGQSGSGKTGFIINAIKMLRQNLNFKTAVIKNIHEHQIDKKGKDSFKFIEAGANYAITRNIYNENTIFIKKEVKLPQLIDWISAGPFKIDLIFTEGFRTLDYPTILCVKELDEIESQLTPNVKMISGLICGKKEIADYILNIPIINIERDFQKFLSIFNIK
jgi:molybdopterin-guanine dinucleotide biosynthesis protein B